MINIYSFIAVLNTRLKSINNKNKKEYEDELAEYNLNMKMHLKSKIDVGFKKVGKTLVSRRDLFKYSLFESIKG